MNTSVRSEALRLRLQGKSYNEIHATLGVSKSTLSGWFSDTVLSAAAVKRLQGRVAQGTLNGLIKRNKFQTHKSIQRARAAQNAARQRIQKLTKEDLIVVGSVLYWAEGYKRLRISDGKERMGHPISFVNADADMIRVFIRFAREILQIPPEKFRLHMRLYAHINEQEALRHWMSATGLPKSAFGKTTYLVSGSSKGYRPYTRLPYGTLQVGIYNTEKFHTLLGFIDGVKNAF